ncbi:hypothetical protein M2254_000330 [Chryseobacterium sp. BIGb0186]|nr:hypothetical protein [Chryseobacterium sp. JUb44]MDH6208746.1 hypothetical protein [Chryseobacterium sp. BIGb0186]
MEDLVNYYHLLNAERMGVGRQNFNIIVKIDRLHSLTRLINFFQKNCLNFHHPSSGFLIR